MKIYQITFILLVLTGTACNKIDYQYRDISEFKMNESALGQNEEVEIIYTSGGPDLNKELNYLYHWIVVSKKTGDTVNLLTPYVTNFSETDKVRIFVGQERLEFDHAMKVFVGEDYNDEVAGINKVIGNPNDKKVWDNEYPAIIGLLGVLKDGGLEIAN